MMQIELGCLTRPWHKFPMEEALAGIAAAGFATCGFGLSHLDQTLITDESEEADIARLRAMLDAHGLKAQALLSNTSIWVPVDQAVAELKRTIDRAHRLGISYIVLMGTDDEAKYDDWYAATERCLDHAGQQGVLLVLKAHGGLSATAEDLLRAHNRLSHPSFGVCYDPGNIYHYTGEKAEDDLPKVAAHVKAMCIKDIVGGKGGEVMITPGTGVVSFPRIFSILDDAGFSGPCWVECLGGKALDEVNAEAAKTRRYITDIVRSI